MVHNLIESCVYLNHLMTASALLLTFVSFELFDENRIFFSFGGVSNVISATKINRSSKIKSKWRNKKESKFFFKVRFGINPCPFSWYYILIIRLQYEWASIKKVRRKIVNPQFVTVTMNCLMIIDCPIETLNGYLLIWILSISYYVTGVFMAQ